ncbi:MAG: hypothetical protein PHI44_04310 [Candidatus Ratteibacteria bacterium]|nr:hypothetical protein [Candidatus Ratteibacteria bacterium]
MERKSVHIWKELRHHLPFSVLSVSIGLMFVGIFTVITEMLGVFDISPYSEELFHIFHPVHMLFSAIATTAMFWQHERRVFKAVVIGFVGSVGICGISDIIIPYISGFLLGAHMQLHICIVEHPHLILPFVFLGILMGFLAPGTLEKQEGVIFSHSLHVLVSAIASILYLISYGVTGWIHRIGIVLIYMVLAVVIPCCTSDIVFPLLFTKEEK